MEAKIAKKGPVPVEVEAGKTIYWCACGQSAKQPYCDGSHAGSEFGPLPYTPTKTGHSLPVRLQTLREPAALRWLAQSAVTLHTPDAPREARGPTSATM
jgi:hypothetical protein